MQARKHLLVLARIDDLERLADVHKEHLPLLNTMHAVGLKWVEKFLNDNESLVFRLGYHSVCNYSNILVTSFVYMMFVILLVLRCMFDKQRQGGQASFSFPMFNMPS